jgi:anion-transporting  ArsA/GET3 family ATPase
LDCLIVDCAPTGETLRLLSFPDAARWYTEKLFPWERRLMRTVRPAIQPLLDVPLPRDPVFAGIERLFHRVEEIKQLLVDPSRTTVRLVLNPEKVGKGSWLSGVSARRSSGAWSSGAAKRGSVPSAFPSARGRRAGRRAE